VYSAKEVHPLQNARTLASAPLTQSLFAKPMERENLSEEVIQRILDAPVEPDFPSRAGVVVLDAPFSRKAYASIEPGDEAPQVLAREIERSRHFVMVSDISPYLANGQHIESLRELATRYRLKYLVIYNRRYVDRSTYNSWGWGWLSLLGIPFLPAYTLQTSGLLEATLLDVRTGTFLFTTQIHLEARERTTPFGTEEKIGRLQRRASRNAAELLARRFLAKCNRLVAEMERQRSKLRAEKLQPRANKERTTPVAPSPGVAAPDGA